MVEVLGFLGRQRVRVGMFPAFDQETRRQFSLYCRHIKAVVPDAWRDLFVTGSAVARGRLGRYEFRLHE